MQKLISKTEQIVAPKKEKSLPSQSEQIRIKRKLSKRVKRNRLIAAGIVALLILIGWSLFVGPGARVVVPSVAGLTVKSATKEFTSLGLVTEIKEEVFSEDVAAGKIIAGARLCG